MGTWRRGAAGLLLTLLAAGCATVEIQGVRTVRGRVVDEVGQPVAGTPVLLVARRLELRLEGLDYVERSRREVRTTTDAGGGYRIEFTPAILGNQFYLFFYDEARFDRVRYASPPPHDLTERLREERELVIDQGLRVHPAWPEVQRQMAYYGPDSERGGILRRHGLPDKREPAPPGGEALEVWWYYADGVSYRFGETRLLQTQTFPPIPGSAPRR